MNEGKIKSLKKWQCRSEIHQILDTTVLLFLVRQKRGAYSVCVKRIGFIIAITKHRYSIFFNGQDLVGIK